MIDYCNTEIVQHVDNLDSHYLDRIGSTTNTLTTYPDYGQLLFYDTKDGSTHPYYVYRYADSGYKNSSLTSYFAVQYLGISSTVNIMDGFLLTSPLPDIAYYEGSVVDAYLTLSLVDQNSVPQAVKNMFALGFSPPIDEDVSTVHWLYDFGQQLSFLGSEFSSILEYKIGGVPLLLILLGSGFTLYMGWTIIKWFIPT